MNINATLIGQAIWFAVFIWITMKYVWPPLQKAMADRQAQIAEGLAAAERGKHEQELAAKRSADGIYFAGIDTAQLQWFLERFGWPEPTRVFVADHADDFAHVRWDVGLDYVATSGGLRWVKSGLYGTC